jgi:hypothetical protein
MAGKVKRKPVLMPAKPPYSVLRAMAGEPLILAASAEQWMREVYSDARNALRKAGK